MAGGLAAGIVVIGVFLGLMVMARWNDRGERGGLGGGFLIRKRAGGAIEVRGGIPKSKVFEIRDFCHQDLGESEAFTVRGSWGPGKNLQLRCTGDLNPGQRQKVRNFLLQCLN